MRLEALETRLGELDLNIEMLEWEIERVETADVNDVASSLASAVQPKYHEDAEWRQLDVDVLTRKHEMAKSRRDVSHPEMVEAKEDLEFAKELLEVREAQLDEQWRHRTQGTADPNRAMSAKGLESLRHRLDRAEFQRHKLRAALAERRQDFGKLLDTARQLESAKTDLRHQQEVYDAIRRRLEQRHMERRMPHPIRILTRAVTSSKPYRDRRMLFTAIALAGAVVLGSLATFLGRKREVTA